MQYITVAEAAKKWNVSPRQVSRGSSRHKDELWRELLRLTEAERLSDDELDAAAGGTGKPEDEDESP